MTLTTDSWIAIGAGLGALCLYVCLTIRDRRHRARLSQAERDRADDEEWRDRQW